MEYIYGALLLHSAGKEINEGDLTKVLEAAGVSVEAARVKAVLASIISGRWPSTSSSLHILQMSICVRSPIVTLWSSF